MPRQILFALSPVKNVAERETPSEYRRAYSVYTGLLLGALVVGRRVGLGTGLLLGVLVEGELEG